MTDREKFANDIVNNPADDTVRLVYADWLDEHGEPERAEFIRVQIARSKVDRKTRPEDDFTIDQHYDARDILGGPVARNRWWPSHVGTSPYFKVRAVHLDVCEVEYESQDTSNYWMNRTIRFRRGFVHQVCVYARDLADPHGDLFCFLLRRPLERIYVFDTLDHIDVVPPGNDYKWQAYWYHAAASTTRDYHSMTGGYTRESLFEDIARYAHNRM